MTKQTEEKSLFSIYDKADRRVSSVSGAGETEQLNVKLT